MEGQGASGAAPLERPLRPVFVVGCPRSGTTLVQQQLSRHPDLAIAPETHFVRRFVVPVDRYGDLADDRAMHRLVDDVLAAPETARMRVDPAVLRAACLAGPRTPEAVFGHLLRGFAAGWAVGVVGEKTPNHVLYLPWLERAFPEARFVHVLRDPRAVAHSWRTVPWSTGSLAGDARVWRRYVAAAAQRPPRRAPLLLVRYEHLVADPDGVVRRLLRDLGLDPDRLPVDAPAEPSRAGLLDVAGEPWQAGALRPVAAGGGQRWQEEMTPDEVAAVERVTWRWMRHWGYPPRSRPWTLAPGLLSDVAGAARRRLSRTAT